MSSYLIHLVKHDDGLVHYLLQLGVLQVVPGDHLQHLVQLTIGYVTIIVHVVDSQNKKSLYFSLYFDRVMILLT